MYKLIRKSEGLTLVEIIISLAILGIIIVPLSTLFVNSAMINRRAEIQLLANQTAQRFMEEYKMKSFGELYSIMVSTPPHSYDVGDDMQVFLNIATLGALPVEITFDSTSTITGTSDVSLIFGDSNIRLVKLEVKTSAPLNISISNTVGGLLVIHKYATDGFTDNTTTSVVEGHVEIINHGTEFVAADRYQSAGLVITVTVKRDGQQLVEMAQARKLEW